MNFTGSKLYKDSGLDSLHKVYKECVAKEIEKAFSEGVSVTDEVCQEEKTQYWAHLHSKKRVEHDNLVAFFKTLNEAS